jgi:hypothetical protein
MTNEDICESGVLETIKNEPSGRIEFSDADNIQRREYFWCRCLLTLVEDRTRSKQGPNHSILHNGEPKQPNVRNRQRTQEHERIVPAPPNVSFWYKIEIRVICLPVKYWTENNESVKTIGVELVQKAFAP